jgi:hypothetical protein
LPASNAFGAPEQTRVSIIDRSTIERCLAQIAAWNGWTSRAPTAVRVVRDDDGWLTIVGSHAWLHSDRRSALVDALWLAANTGLPIRRHDREGAS